MADGSLIFDTKVDESGFTKGANNLGSVAKNALGVFGGNLMTKAFDGLVNLGKGAIDAGKSFDSSMSQVAATMGVTVDEIGNLRDFAQEMGSTTAFSASEAADALNYMALAGYDAETSMGMLPNVLNLAAAGGMELATASDMITDSQTALGLSLEETETLVDQMAKTSSKTNTSVSQLGEAILTIGGTAKNLSGGTTELNQVLGILADNGIKGAEAGTHLRNMMLALMSPTDKASDMLESLGVTVTDAEGNMLSMDNIMGQLNSSLDGLGAAERADIISTIFNKTDIASVNALLDTTQERWNEVATEIDGAWLVADSFEEQLAVLGTSTDTMTANLSKLGLSTDDFSEALKMSGGNAEDFADLLWEWSDAGVSYEDVVDAIGVSMGDLQTAMDNTAGAASAMADTQLDNLAGDITLFQSALEGAEIALSDGLTPSLRGLVQFGASALSELTEAFKEDGVAGAVEALTGILTTALENMIGMLPGFLDVAVQIIVTLIQGIASSLPTLIPAAIDAITTIVQGLIDNLPLLLDAALQLILGLAEGLIAAIPQLIEALPAIIEGIVDFLVGAIPMIIDAGIQLLMALIEAIPVIIDALIDALPQIIEAIVDGLVTGMPLIIEGSIQLFMAILEALPEIIVALAEALPEIITTIGTALADGIPKIFEGAKECLGQIIEAFPEIVAGVAEAVPDIISGIVNGLADGAKALWDAACDLGSNILGGIKSFFGINSPSTVMAEQGDYLVQGIMNGLEAMPDKMNQILTEAVSKLQAWGADMLSKAQTAMTTMLNKIITVVTQLPGKIWTILVQVVNRVTQWGVQMVNNASTAMSNMLSKIISWVSQLPGKIWTYLTDCAQKVVSWGVTMVSNASTAMSNMLSKIVSWANQIPGKLWEYLSQAAQKVVSWGTDLASKGAAAAKGLFDAVVNGVKELPGKMLEVGKNIVTGIWDGISSGWDWLKNKVSNLASSLLDSAKSALGINSPSRAFRDELGKWLMPGAVEGIEKSMPSALKTVRKNATALLDEMTGAVTGNLGSIGMTASVAMAGAGGGTVVYNEEHFEQTNSYYTPVVTPSETAKANREAFRNMVGGVK